MLLARQQGGRAGGRCSPPSSRGALAVASTTRPLRSLLLPRRPTTRSCSSGTAAAAAAAVAAVVRRGPAARRSSGCRGRARHVAASSAPASGPLFGSHLSRRLNLEFAVEDAVQGALASAVPHHQQSQQQQAGKESGDNDPADPWQPTVALAFVSSAFVGEYESLVPLLRRRLPSLEHILATTGYGVVGSTGPLSEQHQPDEVEHSPAVSVALLRPGPGSPCEIVARHVASGDLPDADAPPAKWAEMIGLSQWNGSGNGNGGGAGEEAGAAAAATTTSPANPNSSSSPFFIVYADPTFSRIEELLNGLDYAYPDALKVGGLSGAGNLSASRATWCWSLAAEQAARRESARLQAEADALRAEADRAEAAGEDADGRKRAAAVEAAARVPPPHLAGVRSAAGAVVGGSSASAAAGGGGLGGGATDSSGMLRTGAVVLGVRGGQLALELMVAQGCRPLSPRTYTIDQVAGHSNVVVKMAPSSTSGAGASSLSSGGGSGASISPVEALQQELSGISSDRAEIARLLSNMVLGVEPLSVGSAAAAAAAAASAAAAGGASSSSPSSPSSSSTTPGDEAKDWLVRGAAFDKAGFMFVGDRVRAGARCRFMVRDRQGAEADLRAHGLAYRRRRLAAQVGGGLFGALGGAAEATPADGDQGTAGAQQQQQQQPAPPRQKPKRRRPIGSLLVTCNGRGTNLFGAPSFDARTVSEYVPVGVAGFLANGEIGTVAGGVTKLHGFTAVVGVLQAEEEEEEGEGEGGGER